MGDRLRGRKRQRRNRRILNASDVCHICGHPGADAVDHVTPLARGGRDDATNLAPSHHFEPCPECGIKCNRVKADHAYAPVVRRSSTLARREPVGEVPPTAEPGPSSA